MTTRNTRRSYLTALCAVGLLESCAHTSVLVQPCKDAARNSPVTTECVAAAIAETAFLEETRHSVRDYLIVRGQHGPEAWHFLIELGTLNSPGPDGGHYFAFVDRRTGRVNLVAGR